MTREYAEWLLGELQQEWFEKYGKYMRFDMFTGDEWVDVPEEEIEAEAILSDEIDSLMFQVIAMS